MVTFELGDIHAELVALFEDAPAACLDEGVEFDGELVHAVAQLIEAEVNGGKRVGHRGRVSRR